MAANDWLSLAEGRAAANIDATITDFDTELATVISGISETGDTLVGPVVVRAVTEFHTGYGEILLRQTPVSTITSVTEYNAAGTGTVLSAEDFDTKPAQGYLLEADGHLARVTRRYAGSAGTWLVGSRNIVVVFNAGRAANTAAVPFKFKEAAKLIMAIRWPQRAGAWARSQDFDEGAEFPANAPSIEQLIRQELASELLPPGIG